MRTAVGTVRVGMDLVSVAEVAESVARFGDRYVTRLFTPHEIETCRTDRGVARTRGTYAVESLAARFAAKEAVVKVLRPVELQPDWRSIEIHQMTGGWCEIRLSGNAAVLAAEAGIAEFSVSLTHEASMAGAFVVGRCSPRERGDG
jgi:holo-[acyl-carrier protein] synthase